jgi:hypothetical protein
VHIYWSYPDALDAIQRLRGIARVPETLPVAGRRPLFITEFGVRGDDWHGPGKEPGVFSDGTPMTRTPTAALQVGWLMTEATRLGFVATVQWEGYDMAYGKHAMHYGIIGEPGEGWPPRPAYHVLRLFTHTIVPGSRELAVDGDATNVAFAAVQSPKGNLTLMALNHSATGQTISVTGLPLPKNFHRILWTSTVPDCLQEEADVPVTGLLELTLPPRSLTALAEKVERLSPSAKPSQ